MHTLFEAHPLRDLGWPQKRGYHFAATIQLSVFFTSFCSQDVGHGTQQAPRKYLVKRRANMCIKGKILKIRINITKKKLPCKRSYFKA